MTIGIIGRHERLLATAIATAGRAGHAALGTTRDAEALEWIDGGAIDALVIGGGVEPASRAMLAAAGRSRGIRVIEVFGPGHLEEALAEL